MELKNLSPEIREELKQNAIKLQNDKAAVQELSLKTGLSVKDIFEIIRYFLEELPKPSSPDTNNHETGFWKGAAITALMVLGGIFMLKLNDQRGSKNDQGGSKNP